MEKILYTCPCSRKGEFDVRYNLMRTLQEIVEWLQHPCKDEYADVVINISCLLHSIIHAWIWVLPGAESSVLKGRLRFALWGCCRSQRNRCS